MAYDQTPLGVKLDRIRRKIARTYEADKLPRNADALVRRWVDEYNEMRLTYPHLFADYCATRYLSPQHTGNDLAAEARAKRLAMGGDAA